MMLNVMNATETPASLHTREYLQKKLIEVRKASMFATEKGDFRKVAQLTMEAAQINRQLALPPTEESH
jgi:hypothetical protein